MYDSSLLIYSALKTDSIINDESKNRFFQLYQSHYKKDIWQPSVPFDFLEFTKDKHIANLAFNNREIKVFGGDQLRPNIHIKDMTFDLFEEKKSEIF